MINLFDLGKRYQQGEPDYYINEYINRQYAEQSTANKNSGLYSQQNTGLGVGTNANLLTGAEMSIQLKEEEDYSDAQEEKNSTNEPFQHETSRSQLNINLNNLS